MAAIVVPATSAAAATAEPASTAARTVCFRPRFIHGQGTPAIGVSIESGDCRFGFVVIRHLDESKSARTPCVAISHHCYAFDCSIRLEELTEVSFGRAEREISYEDFLHVFSFG
jgi:hypothetical protein